MDDPVGIEDVETRASELFDKPVPERHRDPRQRYALVTIVAPEGTNQRTKDGSMLMRIYGCAETLEAANAWALRLRDSNDFFDVYTIELHEWVTLPPNVAEIDDVNMTDKRVQSIRDSYVAHLKGTKKDLAERLEGVQKIRERELTEKQERLKQLAPYVDAMGKELERVPDELKDVLEKAQKEEDFKAA